MKEIYVAAEQGIVSDIEQVFRVLDPYGDKYKLILNPFEQHPTQQHPTQQHPTQQHPTQQQPTLQQILDVNSGTLDLMLLPLHLSDESRRAAVDRYDVNCAMKFDGVKMALEYAKQGYQNPIVLATETDFSATQAMSVENAGGYELKAYTDVALKKSFLSLYSAIWPESSKYRLFLHLLEGIPAVDMSIVDFGTGCVVEISAEPGILPED